MADRFWSFDGDTRAILLVPSPEWRERLLADGACGARVPQLWHRWTWGDDADVSPEESAALVLAFDGAVVREGRDRAAYALAEMVGLTTERGVRFRPAVNVGGEAGWALHGDQDGYRTFGARSFCTTPSLNAPPGLASGLDGAWALATVCAARGLGTVVVLP